jgi:hypothetical protein
MVVWSSGFWKMRGRMLKTRISLLQFRGFPEERRPSESWFEAVFRDFRSNAGDDGHRRGV